MSRLEKQRHILDFTLASLLRRKGKLAALTAVYTLVVFMTASAVLFARAIRREASIVLKDAPAVVVQRTVAGRQALLPAAHIERIAAIRGVSEVRGRLWGYYFDEAFGGANYTLVVPDAFPYEPGTIVVGAEVARNSGTLVDNLLPFKAHDGTVVGYRIGEILSAESALVSADLVLMAEPDFRSLFGVPEGEYTDIVLSVRNPRETGTVARKIVALLPDTRPILREEILRTYDAVFSWRAGLLLAILAGSLAAFVIFAWDRATGLSAEERREIGILKAVGWETADVLTMKFWEGAVVSLSSFLTGVVLAYAHVFFASASLFEPVIKGWSVLYPEFRLAPTVDASEMAALFFVTVVPYTVATIIPSWRAATVDPDAVMRA